MTLIAMPTVPAQQRVATDRHGAGQSGVGERRASASAGRAADGAGSAPRPAASTGRRRRSAGSRPRTPPRSSGSGTAISPIRARHPGRHDLGDQLLVEHEVVAVEVVRDGLEQVPAVGAQARVVFGQVEPEGQVLEAGQEPVADVLPARHPAGQRVAQEPAAEHQVARAGGDRGDEGGDPRRVVLVVGVEHDDDLGAGRQGRVVARLLVAAVAAVLAVDDDVEPELPGDVDGLVARHVVDQDDLVDEVVRDVRIRALERPRRVVGGHHDDEARRGRLARIPAWARAKGTAAAPCPPGHGSVIGL